MPAPSTAESTNMVCLHCSPARTVWLQREPGTATKTVRKIYVAGSLSEAEHEVAMGKAAAGVGVIQYLAAETDAQSNRPSVRLAYAKGQNLETLVAEHGAIAAVDAVSIVGSVATTLARLHTLRTEAIPHGICHGDVKPQNILLVADANNGPDAEAVLLDFEHAIAIGAHRDAAFTGGTHAYSPPEAIRGERPTAAFDVFGLGATLAFMLDGGIGRRVPRHPEVEALVLSCCAPAGNDRPTAAEFAERCTRLSRVLRDDELEQNLQDWASGACQYEPTNAGDARAVMWNHRKRLLQRLPTLLQAPTTVPNDPEGMQSELDLVLRVLARFPRNGNALARRRQLLDEIRKMLRTAAAIVRERNKAEQFDDSLRWLRTTEALLVTTLSVAGGLAAVTKVDEGMAPGALQRAPIDFLQLLVAQTQGAEQELQRRADQISAAEQSLDLTSAENEIDAMAADYGGTSKTVAERRDQLHRLGFYLDRIARAESKVERVGPMWDPVALQPLQSLVSDAAEALETSPRRESSGSGAVGLRSLQVTLTNTAEEFPHLEQVKPALDALTSALLHLTDQAWQQLDDAEQRLNIVPVPVRPLQLALGRLDTFRMLEAFVDRPDRPRSELLDGIERLRLGLEQARSARDRLAENAEHALARGHWTTGLFDMERAVERLNTDDESEHVEAERLRERLQAARRTKQEIEAAVRRNVELTTNYTTLEDDPLSTAEARIRVLQERRDCLMFLGLHVPNERADLYRKDLRSVETQLAVERAADAEQRLDALTEPLQRLRLARNTVELLSANGSSDGGEQPGRLVRLQEHWRTVAMQCQRTVDAEAKEQEQRQRQRRRTMTIAIIAFVVTTSAIGFALKPWLFGEPVMAAPK